MPITLDDIPLPDDIQWRDEFAGAGVGQQITPTLTGALVVEESAQPAGRPITLASNGGAWVSRAVLERLAARAATPLAEGQTLTLVWGDGRTFPVVFDRGAGAPIEAHEVMRTAAAAQAPDHAYLITLRLMTG